ncbi:zinc finger CCCH domain-containing protein 39-like [Cucurbita moschata]|uniref:Zinc finger CCCH domain-containing protein 39-like n=1 Tax=Cucurbita moschata TaxID=3662 RepID=A0A6J1HGS0_CUCMO|nr:zinc finger CCCH domain-containing protein 39-like [Cucurbita moschata]
MSDPYPFHQVTPPDHEARGVWPPLRPPPLPPRYTVGRFPSFYQPTMSEIVPSRVMPSNFEIPQWNNVHIGLHDNELEWRYALASNDHTRGWLPSWRGIEFHENRLPECPIVNSRTGMSTEMKVCRQFQRRGKCAYGDQCRFLHKIPENTKDFGSSSQNHEVRAVASGHVMDGKSMFDQFEEVRSKVQTKIVARSEIPMPVNCKTRLCYLWQTTGHCSYGEVCRFAHGEAELQKLESCSTSERGRVGGASATTKAAAAAGLRCSRGIGTDCKNKGSSRMKQLFKSKEHKKLIGIYADWLEN